MSNSTVSNLWIDHMKVGAWMDAADDRPTFAGCASGHHPRRQSTSTAA